MRTVTQPVFSTLIVSARSIQSQTSCRLVYIARMLAVMSCCWAAVIGSYGQTPLVLSSVRNTVSCDLAITTNPPASSAICSRGIVTASVSATGNQPLSYQWYKDGTALSNVANITGVTSATLTIVDAQTVSAGIYSVVVSSSCTSQTATPFSLSIGISTHPDYNALADLFYSTNGVNWSNKTNWLTNCDPCGGWFGVTCSQGRATTLELTSNRLDGNLPESFGNLSALKRVTMYYNPLRGSLPGSIGQLKNLEYLNLQLNQFTGPIPAGIRDMPALTSLILSGNQLTNGIPASFSSLQNLTNLDLSANPLGGTIPESLSTLTNLTSLSLRGNQLQGGIASWIGTCKNLQLLNLVDNSLTGTIPDSFSALKSLKQLELANNRLSGPLPGFLTDLSGLYDITVSNNQFTGEIPGRISALTGLIFLSLDNNQLTGEIPRDFGRLVHLSFLYLHNNRLSGSIPDSLGKLTSLLYMRFNNNQLTGQIPNQFKTMQTLRELDLSSNQLEGSIPNSIGQVAGLQILRLNTNKLSGCIPASLSILCGKVVTIGNNPGLPNNGDFNAFCATGAGSYNGTLTTIQSGYWHNKAIWSCERVPQTGDRAVIQHPVTVAPTLLNEAGQIRLEGVGKLIYEANGVIRLSL